MASTSAEGPTAMDTVDDTGPPSETGPTSDTTAMEAETSPLLDNSKIPTKAIVKYFDASKLLPEAFHVLSQTPFAGAYGEGDKYAHDSILSLSLLVKKISSKSSTLDAEVLRHARKPGPTCDEFLLAATQVFTNESESLSVLTTDETLEARVILRRLSHTPPLALFPTENGTTPATTMSRAWLSAVMSLGSWYYQRVERERAAKASALKAVRDKSKKRQGKLTDSFIQAPETLQLTKKTATSSQDPKTPSLVSPDPKNPYKRSRADPQAQQSKPASTPATKTPTKSALKKAPVKVYAANVLSDSVKEYRVTFRFMVSPSDDGSSADITARIKFQHFLEAVILQDPTLRVLPWDKNHWRSVPVIQRAEEVCIMSLSTFRSYTDQFRPATGKNCWFRVAFALTMEPQHLLSGDTSDNSSWFADNNAAAFPVAVQGSSDTKVLGVFLYSGGFTNADRLKQAIQDAAVKRFPQREKPLRLGCRLTRNSEVEKSEDTSWTMAENQMIVLEVDSADERLVKTLVYETFNKITDAKKRPGGYNLRFLPDKKIAKAGSGGAASRHNSLRKHSCVIQSLHLLRSSDIKALDKSVKINSSHYTLREIIHGLKFPLVPDDDEPFSPLFFSVDAPSQGKEVGKVIYLTAYHDKSELADRMLGVLPAYVSKLVDEKAAREWFHADAIASLQSVQFTSDEEGNWDGRWTTPDDDLMTDILDEDMGVEFEFEFDGGIPGFDTPIVSLTADDASVTTYGNALRVEDQQTGSGSLAGTAAAAESGRSGEAV